MLLVTDQAASEIKPSALLDILEAPLPPDWIIKASRKDPAKSYYFNTVTREVSWSRPKPAEIEPETPPLPTQDLPDVEPIPGQEGQPVDDGHASEDGKVPEKASSSAAGPAVKGVEAPVSAGDADVEGDEATSPADPETVIPAQRYGERSRQFSDQSNGRNGGMKQRNARRGNRRLDRRDGGHGRGGPSTRERERAQPVFRGSEVPHAARPHVGESRRRDEPDEMDDRGSSKRLRVDHPDPRDQVASAPSVHRDEQPPGRAAMPPPLQPRADMDRRDQQSRRTFFVSGSFGRFLFAYRSGLLSPRVFSN